MSSSPASERDAAPSGSGDLQAAEAYRLIDSGQVWRTSPEFEEWHRSGAISAQRSLFIAALLLTAFLMTWPFLPLVPGETAGRAAIEAFLILMGLTAVGFAVAGMSRYVALRRAFTTASG